LLFVSTLMAMAAEHALKMTSTSAAARSRLLQILVDFSATPLVKPQSPHYTNQFVSLSPHWFFISLRTKGQLQQHFLTPRVQVGCHTAVSARAIL
jgi:hypothetical protein